ncbi:hypothetical protein PpBr36_08541 [Pyricularia pennisetigena]|nr:hypothetical protein PpBr36_08541 [Pyricularia pennisetigena]TLS24864.1 hypothetical protein PpBr36_08541 [Pyricularia pennisetigena]
MFDKVAVQRMNSGEVVLGGVDWAHLSISSPSLLALWN